VEKSSPRPPLAPGPQARSSKQRGSGRKKTLPKERTRGFVKRNRQAKQGLVPSPPPASPRKPGNNDPDRGEGGGEEPEARSSQQGGDAEATVATGPQEDTEMEETIDDVERDETETEPETEDEGNEDFLRFLAKSLSTLKRAKRAGPMALRSDPTKGITDITVAKELLGRNVTVDVHSLTLACLLFDLQAVLDNFFHLLSAVHNRSNKAPETPVKLITFDTIFKTPESVVECSSSELSNKICNSYQKTDDLMKRLHLDEFLYAHSCYEILLYHKHFTEVHKAEIAESKKAKLQPPDSSKATASARAFKSMAATLQNLPLPRSERGHMERLKEMVDYGRLVESATQSLQVEVLFLWPRGFSSMR
jgi:hypothetical protein